MSKKITTGIAICTYNRPQYARLLLQDIKTQTIKPNQLVFIEDVSSCKHFSKKFLENYFSNMEIKIYYHHCVYKNIAKSRNKILKHLDIDLLICIDDDVRIYPDHVEKLVTYYKRYPQVFGFFGEVLPISSDPISVVSSYYFNQEFSNKDKITKTTTASFISLALNTKILNKYQFYFDAEYPIGEDIDFLNNFSKKGEFFLYLPTVKILHSFSADRKDSLISFISRFYLYGKYAAKLHFLKNYYCFEVDYFLPKKTFHYMLFPIFVFHRIFRVSHIFHGRTHLDLRYLFWSLLLHTCLFFGIYSWTFLYKNPIQSLTVKNMNTSIF